MKLLLPFLQKVLQFVLKGGRHYFIFIKGTFSIFLKVEAVKLLLSRGADVNYCTLDYSDSSPLHLAVTKLHVQVVKVRRMLFIWQFTKSHGKVAKVMKGTMMAMSVLVMMSTTSTCFVVVKLSVLICHCV